MGKNPWIAAILNFLIFGLGYIYNGKRTVLGFLLLMGVASVYLLTLLPSSEVSTAIEYTGTKLISEILGLGFYFIPLGLAYDAYKEAKDISDETKKGKKK